MTENPGNDAGINHDSTERDRLARKRTDLANERTFLSYVRTAIMLFATGATLLKLFPSSYFNIVIGVLLIGFSFFVLVIGIFRFKAMKSKISNNQ